MQKQESLTSSLKFGNIQSSRQEKRGEFCMKGGVYTKEKCPVIIGGGAGI
jgi:hypothetical protein